MFAAVPLPYQCASPVACLLHLRCLRCSDNDADADDVYCVLMCLRLVVPLWFRRFDLVSSMNHSCRPNCSVSYNDGSHIATVTSLRPLSIGDELLISYVDETATITERRQQLIEYGFKCSCERCEEEARDER